MLPVHIAITGSIATDHLMTFPGRFADSLVPDQLDKISLSFLVDDLDMRRGGVRRQHRLRARLPRATAPLLVGAVGRGLRGRLPRPGSSDARRRHASRAACSETRHTARFVCTTDADHPDRDVLRRGDERGPRDRAAADRAESATSTSWWSRPTTRRRMLRHTQRVPRARHPVRRRPVAAARLGGRRRHPRPGRRRRLPVQQRVRGCADRAEDRLVRRPSPARARRHPDHDARQGRRDGRPGRRRPDRGHATEGIVAVDPTGVGDSFRAGFLAGIAAGLGFERSAQIGCTIAASVVETDGHAGVRARARGVPQALRRGVRRAGQGEIDAALSLA